LNSERSMSGEASGRQIHVQPRRSYRKPRIGLATSDATSHWATIRREASRPRWSTLQQQHAPVAHRDAPRSETSQHNAWNATGKQRQEQPEVNGARPGVPRRGNGDQRNRVRNMAVAASSPKSPKPVTGSGPASDRCARLRRHARLQAARRGHGTKIADRGRSPPDRSAIVRPVAAARPKL
jgi:hypothetical protein